MSLSLLKLLPWLLGFLAFILLSLISPLPAPAAAGEEGRLVVEIRPPAEAGAPAVLAVRGKERSADELQLICKRELENHPDLALVFRIDGRSAYETFYFAVSACYNANVPAVTIEALERSGSGEKLVMSVPFKMPAKPGTDGRPAGFRPEVYVRLYHEGGSQGGRTVAYAFGHENVEPAALKAVVAEGVKTADADKDDVMLVLRAEREISCAEVMAAYATCRDAGAVRVAFGREW